MQIIINPIANLSGQPDALVSVSGDTITVNGEAFDLSAIPEGGEATAAGDHPFTGPIRREGGTLIVPLRVMYDSATAEPSQPVDWDHWTITVDDGPLPDRVIRKEIAE